MVGSRLNARGVPASGKWIIRERQLSGVEMGIGLTICSGMVLNGMKNGGSSTFAGTGSAGIGSCKKSSANSSNFAGHRGVGWEMSSI